MTFLLVTKDHRAIRTDKREWYEFIRGEFITVEEAVRYNVDLRNCYLVDVKNPNKMWWNFEVRRCEANNFDLVTTDPTEFDGQLYRYHYTINIKEDVPFGETPRFGYQMYFDRDDTLTSHEWKKIYAKAKWFLHYNDCPVSVTISRKSRHEVSTPGYSVSYCIANWFGGTQQTWFDDTHPVRYLIVYRLHKKHGQKGND